MICRHDITRRAAYQRHRLWRGPARYATLCRCSKRRHDAGGRGRAWLIGAAALLGLAGLALLAARPMPMPDRYPPATGAPDNHLVWVVSHGWHTGLVVDRAAARGVLVALDDDFSDARYLEI